MWDQLNKYLKTILALWLFWDTVDSLDNEWARVRTVPLTGISMFRSRFRLKPCLCTLSRLSQSRQPLEAPLTGWDGFSEHLCCRWRFWGLLASYFADVPFSCEWTQQRLWEGRPSACCGSKRHGWCSPGSLGFSCFYIVLLKESHDVLETHHLRLWKCMLHTCRQSGYINSCNSCERCVCCLP